jgi:flagellar motor switch protein FliN
MTTPSPTLDAALLAAAEAAAALLPASEPLTPGQPQPGTEGVVDGFAGAAVAELDLPGSPRLAVLVTGDLVAALSESPIGGLDLAAATQPVLDAVAEAFGTSARPARVVDPELVVPDLAQPFTVVPLSGTTSTGTAGALLLPDTLLTEPDAGATGQPAPFASLPATEAPGSTAPLEGMAAARGIEMLHGVDMEVTVELGRTRMTVRDLLALAPGTVLELDRAAGSTADLLVNGRLIARGEVVVIDEDFGLRVTEILDESAAG